MSWTEEEDKKTQLQQHKDPNDSGDRAGSDKNEAIDPNEKIWTLLEKTLNDSLIEKRRARRWRVFFRFTTLLITIVAITSFYVRSNLPEQGMNQSVVAMVPMRGVIGSKADIESADFVELLDKAYDNPLLQGVIIEMNSPGGSPVHSGIIYDAIREKGIMYPDIPVIVVVEDMAASGGYYIASAANKIYANRASLVGSIGVISAGFDASGLLDKIGVERRTFISGRNKAFLDPFSPMTDEATEKWQKVLDETHNQFIDAVKTGRGDRLTITEDVFSGMVFTGSQAFDIGLIDGLSSVNQLLDSYFPNAEPVVFRPTRSSWRDFAKEFAVEVTTSVLNKTTIQ